MKPNLRPEKMPEDLDSVVVSQYFYLFLHSNGSEHIQIIHEVENN